VDPGRGHCGCLKSFPPYWPVQATRAPEREKPPSRSVFVVSRGAGQALARQLRGSPGWAWNPSNPQRANVVVPPAALRSLVDGLGRRGPMNLEQHPFCASPTSTQNFEVDLQAACAEFQGNRGEAMVRFLEPSLGEAGCRIRQQAGLLKASSNSCPALNRISRLRRAA